MARVMLFNGPMTVSAGLRDVGGKRLPRLSRIGLVRIAIAFPTLMAVCTEKRFSQMLPVNGLGQGIRVNCQRKTLA